MSRPESIESDRGNGEPKRIEATLNFILNTFEKTPVHERQACKHQRYFRDSSL